MADYLPGLADLRLPAFHRVAQRFPSPTVADPAAAVASELARPAIAALLRPGQRAAIAVGSRGIAHLAELVAALVAGLRARGVEPFIVPAMGSHGGATAEGQRAVLAGYGVTETGIGAPIRADMATDLIGALTVDGDGYCPCAADATGAIPVYLDRAALREADLVIPVARIKPHTGFRGPVESGIAKMLCIGLGKHIGCARLHREGYGRFATLIPAAAALTLATGKIAFALAVVENAAEDTAWVEAVPAAEIARREPELLTHARTLMPRLLLDEIDVLVIDEIGKDISGTGMDPNVTGRGELGRPVDFVGPRIGRIVVLGLSAATKGNATGIGMADLITRRCADAVDRDATFTNVLTSGSLAGGKLPVSIPGDEAAILAAACCVPGVNVRDARIVWIRNTLRLGEIAVSANLLPTVTASNGLVDLGPFIRDPAVGMDGSNESPR